MVDTVSTDIKARRDLDLVGQVLKDRYRIIDSLGRGGFGAVFRAEDLEQGTVCAVKALRPALIESTEMYNRFRREAQLPSSMGHPNIVDILDSGKSPEGVPFFVMEYLEGEDLGAILRRLGPLPWRRVFKIALQLCSALAAAHQAGILHRDVKPENVFVVAGPSDDFVKVLDFGIAKRTNREGSIITRVGAFIGTPEYMSPEQATGDELDHRVDIYGVGILIYQLIVGEVPFKSKDELEVLNMHAKTPPVRPSVANPHVRLPPEAESLILRALAKRREDRFQTALEMATAMSMVLSDYDELATTDVPRLQMEIPQEPPHNSTWMAVVVGIGLGISVLALAGYFFLT